MKEEGHRKDQGPRNDQDTRKDRGQVPRRNRVKNNSKKHADEKLCHYFYNLCSKASEKTCYAKYFGNVLFFVPNSGILFCVVYTIVKVEQSKYVRAQKVKAQSPLLP